MATITPTTTFDPDRNALKVTWTGITTTTDTPVSYSVKGNGGHVGFVQFSGTFAGGSSASLTHSGDNTNFTAMVDNDGAGTAIVATAAKCFNFSTNALYIKPAVVSGSADDVNVDVWLYG